jgi:integrase
VFAHILPRFGKMFLNEITRKEIQDFLFGLVDQGKNRTAHKIKQLMSNMFVMIADDYDLRNPVEKVVLSHYKVKKGRAFTKDEEKQIIEYCKKNPYLAGVSAVLTLIYTGMRVGELQSIKVYSNYLTCITEKTRRGHDEVVRKIPFTPMLKKVIDLIDFEKARTVSPYSVRDLLKRIFPDRHVHEFRYTFITRAKECGVNPEVVMIWSGHEFDNDVKTSRVDRGYTTYSDEYLFREASKVRYEL